MPQTIIIYGIECQIPDVPRETKVLGDKFVRTPLPDIFKKLEYDADDNPIYKDEHWEFINQEIDRCNDGYWFVNNGVPTYITGFNYFYVNWWVLENGQRPDYRDSDRLFFYFFEHCYNHPKIIGILRGKKRREGASSMGSAISTKIATFSSNKNCGLVSMNDNYAEKLFQTMIVNGFYKLPEFLRPRVDTSSTNKKKLHFIDTPKRGGRTRGGTIEGLNSIMDFMPTTLNSYDSTRLSFLLGDEWGKWEKTDITRYYEIVKECVRVGARKVGFLYAPTTVNDDAHGGKNFKVLWEGSNQFEQGLDTATGMVKFFQPAWEGMEGFIDEYGMSVIEPPNEKTLQFLLDKQLQIPDPKERVGIEDLQKGAKKYIQDEYAKLKTEEQKSDFKRKFPTMEQDLWNFGSAFSPFNIDNIDSKITDLYNNPIPLRRGKLELQTESFVGTNGDLVHKYNVEFVDDLNGNWLIRALPEKPNNFEINWDRKSVTPLNTLEYAGGSDTFRSDKSNQLGSKGTIVIGSKFDETKPDGGGTIDAIYVGRPKLTQFFWKELMLAGLYWGCTITTEADATQEVRKYMANTMKNELDLNCLSILGRKPNEAFDPTRKNNEKSVVLTFSSDPFVYAKMVELAQIYFEKYCNKIQFPQILEEAKLFNPDERTKFDLMIGFMMCLLNLTGQTKSRKTDYKNEKIIQEYEIKGTKY